MNGKPFTDADRIDFLHYWLHQRKAWIRISTNGRVTAIKNRKGTVYECDPDGECIFDMTTDAVRDLREELDDVMRDAIRHGYYMYPTGGEAAK